MPHEHVSCAPRRSTPRGRFVFGGASIVAPLAFICSNLVICWTDFRTNTFLFLLVATGFVLYAVYYHAIARKSASRFGWKNIAWLLP